MKLRRKPMSFGRWRKVPQRLPNGMTIHFWERSLGNNTVQRLWPEQYEALRTLPLPTKPVPLKLKLGPLPGTEPQQPRTPKKKVGLAKPVANMVKRGKAW